MTGLILTQENFYTYLQTDTFPSGNIIIDFEVILDGQIINWQFRKLKNITFEKKVIVRNVEINSGLSSNCRFGELIVFHNVSFDRGIY